MRQPTIQRLAALLLIAALIPACGGGSGGGAPAVPPTPTPAVVQLAAVAASFLEGSLTATLTVNRVGGTGQDVTVQFATADGTATAGADYTSSSGILTWAAADFAAKTINVPIADLEGLIEGEETFTVTLSVPTGATLGTNTVATVTIEDGDSPPDGVFQFSALTYTVTEDAAATTSVTVTVRRTGGTVGDVTVQCNVAAGTATAASDYTAPLVNPVLLSWLDGDATPQTFTIDILNDGVDTAGIETILLTLQTPTPAPGPEISVSQGAATVEILDRDQIGTLQFSAAAYQVSENGLEATITVSRVNGALGAVGVSVSLGGGTSTAVAGTDYSDGAILLAWADGDIADQTFVVPVIDDVVGDGFLLLEMLLHTPTGGATIAGTNPAILTIADDEAGVLVFTSDVYAAPEGNAGPSVLTITVNRVGGSLGAASVEVAVADGTATAGDYSVAANPVVLNWVDGDATPQTFDITLAGDLTFELDETVLLSLQNSSGAVVGAPAAAVATITNDDLPPGGTIVLSAATYGVTEGTPTLTVTVNRTGLNTLPVSVTFKTLNGTAKGKGKNRDFTSVSTVVNFAASDTTEDVVINITDDAFVEVPETFRVQLSVPTNQSVLGTPNTATVTITSDE